MNEDGNRPAERMSCCGFIEGGANQNRLDLDVSAIVYRDAHFTDPDRKAEGACIKWDPRCLFYLRQTIVLNHALSFGRMLTV